MASAFNILTSLEEQIKTSHPSSSKDLTTAKPRPFVEAQTIANLPFNPRSIL